MSSTIYFFYPQEIFWEIETRLLLIDLQRLERSFSGIHFRRCLLWLIFKIATVPKRCINRRKEARLKGLFFFSDIYRASTANAMLFLYLEFRPARNLDLEISWINLFKDDYASTESRNLVENNVLFQRTIFFWISSLLQYYLVFSNNFRRKEIKNAIFQTQNPVLFHSRMLAEIKTVLRLIYLFLP